MGEIIQFPIDAVEYRKLKVEYPLAKDRFYRIVYVRTDVGLVELSLILCSVLGASEGHMFFLKDKLRCYLVPQFLEDDGYRHSKDVCAADYALGDIASTFTFCYDMGDYWTFHCRLYKSVIQRPDCGPFFITEGAGQGIWEDNRYSLDMYLTGNVDAACTTEEAGYNSAVHLPWNYENTCFGDFDKAFVPETEQEEAGRLYRDVWCQFLGYDDILEDDEDEDFEDDGDDEDADDMVARALDTVTVFATLCQIEKCPAVKKVYEKLKKKHGEDAAKEAICDVIAKELCGLITQDFPYGTGVYMDALKKLK